MDHITHQRISRAFYAGIILNVSFAVLEFIAGLVFDSLALLSDAVHNLGDVGSLVIALIAYRLARIAPTKRFTYGFGKTTILASLINATILLVVTGGIVREAVLRLSHSRPADGAVIMMVAGIGIIINSLSALLFFRDKAHDMNIRGAFLHLMVDALVSVGVVISGLIITVTGWLPADSLVSMAVAVVIIISTWGLFRESLRQSADAVPEGISHDEVVRVISGIKGVRSVHHVHIWAISTTLNSLTAHLVLDRMTDVAETEAVKKKVREELQNLNIAHVTLETEYQDKECESKEC